MYWELCTVAYGLVLATSEQHKLAHTYTRGATDEVDALLLVPPLVLELLLFTTGLGAGFGNGVSSREEEDDPFVDDEEDDPGGTAS